MPYLVGSNCKIQVNNPSQSIIIINFHTSPKFESPDYTNISEI